MSSNQEQIDYWNGQAGETWVRAQARLDALLEPITEALLARASVTADDRVLDVGCGCGGTSLALADRAAAVYGVDVSSPMIEHARARAGDRPGVRFEVADAASADFAPDHDLLFSRFGVMFFADPRSAFRNLHGALASDGRVCFVCWQAPRANPWMAVAGAAVQPFLPEPTAPPDPKAPGPFAFADPDHVRGVLGDAGFADVALEDLRTDLRLAGDLDEALEFQMEIGPLARVMAELDGEARAAALDAARTALAAHLDDDGLRLGATCWIVTARR